MLEKIFAAAVVLACVVLCLRLGLGERRRRRFDAAWREAAARWARRLRLRVAWPSANARAEREAEQAIQRARRRAAGEWDGNVFRARSLKRRKRDLH